MTFDLSSLLLFGLPLVLCAGLLVYALNLRSALQRSEQQAQAEAAITISLRSERDQALQNAIRLEAELDSERKQGLGRIESLNEAKEALTHQFKNLANEILEDKSKRFTEQNVANLDALLKPLQTKLSEFKEQVNTSYGNEA
ncbi:MAG: DNA polymerase V, partial [Polynucleobacter sp. 24-46-87]